MKFELAYLTSLPVACPYDSYDAFVALSSALPPFLALVNSLVKGSFDCSFWLTIIGSRYSALLAVQQRHVAVLVCHDV